MAVPKTEVDRRQDRIEEHISFQVEKRIDRIELAIGRLVQHLVDSDDILEPFVADEIEKILHGEQG